jgi:hypothetical protein
MKFPTEQLGEVLAGRYLLLEARVTNGKVTIVVEHTNTGEVITIGKPARIVEDKGIEQCIMDWTSTRPVMIVNNQNRIVRLVPEKKAGKFTLEKVTIFTTRNVADENRIVRIGLNRDEITEIYKASREEV